MKKISLICVSAILLFVNTTSGQNISEDDLPFKFLSWHYSNYPGAEENQWTRIEKESEEYLFVDFLFEGRNLTVTYKPSGMRIKARTKYTEKDLPSKLGDFLTERFEKYKIDEVMRTDLYEGSRVSDSFYSAKVKVKKEGYIFYFDEAFNRITDPTARLLSSL